MKKRAKGGFITKPEFSLLAEAGFPEVVIPLDGSPNAYRCLQLNFFFIRAFKLLSRRKMSVYNIFRFFP